VELVEEPRVSMREYENGTKENHYTAHPRYYEILKHECGIEGTKSYRKHDKSYRQHDI
jgi:hypothetical protein